MITTDPLTAINAIVDAAADADWTIGASDIAAIDKHLSQLHPDDRATVLDWIASLDMKATR